MHLQDKFYKSTEVAEILGVSLRTLYRYMESMKINSVHLPSGRHRFTKQQIEEFLYSNSFEPEMTQEAPAPRSNMQNNFQNYQRPSKPLEVSDEVRYSQMQPQSVQRPTPVQDPVVQRPTQMPNIKRETTIPTDEELDKQLDELLKSLSSDDSSSQQEESISNTPSSNIDFAPKPVQSYQPTPVARPEVRKVEEVVKDAYVETDDDELDKLLKSLEEDDDEVVQEPAKTPIYTTNNKSFTSLSDDSFDGFRIKPMEDTLDENNILYFYCPHNDLRTIAKIIKKVGEDNGLKYAFTLNAGASLFFPLDPFSIIHFYVHKNDLEIWKKELDLKPSSEADANIGILQSKGKAFDKLNEVSGLKVASKDVLIDNLKSHNLAQLARQVADQL